jgi:hypothetical protein
LGALLAERLVAWTTVCIWHSSLTGSIEFSS